MRNHSIAIQSLGSPLPSQTFAPEQTELHFAAMRGDLDRMRALLQTHPDWVRVSDENQWQPLHEAARRGCVESIQLLLDHGPSLHPSLSLSADLLRS
jgi:ankyrin repeat protein